MAKKTHLKVRMVPESNPDSKFIYYAKKPTKGEKAKVNRFDMCVNSISWGESPQIIRYILTSLPNHGLKKSFVADCSP